MPNNLYYPTPDRLIEYNSLVLTLIKVKKADRHQLLNRQKLAKIIENCKLSGGDVYDKAVLLLKGLIQGHPFASGNRRTAFIATKDFVLTNKFQFSIKDDPSQAKIMIDIREAFYTDDKLREWIKHGKIRAFER